MIKSYEEIYQFFRWYSFRDSYLITIEKSKAFMTLRYKKIISNHYYRSTGEYIEEKFEVLIDRKLKSAEIENFYKLLKKYNFWKHSKYATDNLCTDGDGVLVYALKKDHFLNIDNGNCASNNEYLNNLYSELVTLLNLK